MIPHSPRERVNVVPNAVSTSSLSSPVFAPDKPVIGFVGRLDPQKRVGLLVDAFALALADLPEARLVIVGDGPERSSLIDRVRQHGIEPRVEFTGLVENVYQYMAAFSCLALPSAYEGFPNVALEAVGLGVPVVAAPVGDVEDIVLDGRTGYLMTERSPRALADLLVRAATDEGLKQRTVREGPALVKANYSVDAAIDKLMPVYEKVMSQ